MDDHVSVLVAQCTIEGWVLLLQATHRQLDPTVVYAAGPVGGLRNVVKVLTRVEHGKDPFDREELELLTDGRIGFF